MRYCLLFMLLVLGSCNHLSTDDYFENENNSTIYKKLLAQRRDYTVDQEKARLDTAYNLIERLMVSGDTSLKYRAEALKVSFLLASCDFIHLKEFLPVMTAGAFDYELQRRVYNYYCIGKLDSDTISALENYGKATQLVLDELGISNNSGAAAFDLLYVTHNYISKQRLVFYIDSLGKIFDNGILQDYKESDYDRYKRQTNCEILP